MKAQLLEIKTRAVSNKWIPFNDRDMMREDVGTEARLRKNTALSSENDPENALKDEFIRTWSIYYVQASR